MFLVVLSALARAAYEENGIIYDTPEKMAIITYNKDTFQGTLIIPNTVQKIAPEAFQGCEILKGNIDFPNSVVEIGESAFAQCHNMGRITITESVKTVGAGAFVDSKFESLQITSSGVTFSGRCFCRWSGDITLSATNCVFEKRAFSSLRKDSGRLTVTGSGNRFKMQSLYSTYLSVDVDSSTFEGQSIDYDNYYGFMSMTLSGADNTFGKGAVGVMFPRGDPADFQVHLTNVVTQGYIGPIGSGFGEVEIQFKTVANAAMTGNAADRVIISFTNSVTSIPAEAFARIPTITGEVHFPSSVTSIAANSFNGCSGITSFTIDQNANYKSVDGAILNAGGTSFVLFPEGKTGTYTIPASLTTISNNQFLFGSIETLVAPDGNANFASVDGIIYNKAKDKLIACPKGKTTGVTLPADLRTIGQYAFTYVKALASVSIGNKVTMIERNAFYEANVEQVTIQSGGSLTLSQYCFYVTTGNLTINGAVIVQGLGILVYGTVRITASGCTFNTASIQATRMELNVDDSTFLNRAMSGECIYDAFVLKGDSNRFRANSVACTVEEHADPNDFIVELTNVIVEGEASKTFGRFSAIGIFHVSFASLIAESITQDTLDNYTDWTDISITLADGITQIPSYAFHNAPFIVGTVTIPASVTNLGVGAFSWCYNVTAFEVQGTNFVAKEGVVYNTAITKMVLFPPGKAGEFTIYASLTEVGLPKSEFPLISAFLVESGSATFRSDDGCLVRKADANNISLVMVPTKKTGDVQVSNDIKAIQTGAFAYCSLNQIAIGSSVTQIGPNAFTNASFGAMNINCNGLTIMNSAVDSPSGVIYIKGSQLTVQKYGLWVSNKFREAEGHTHFLTIEATGCTFNEESIYAPRLNLTVSTSVFEARTLGTPQLFETFDAFYLKGDGNEMKLNALQRVAYDGQQSTSPNNYQIELTHLKARASIGECKNFSKVSISFDAVVSQCIWKIVNTQNLQISLTDRCTSLPNNTFGGINELTGTFAIPASVTTIEKTPFTSDTGDVSPITSFTVAEGNPNYKAVDGVVLNKAGTNIVLFPEGRTGEYRLADTITSFDPSVILFSRITALRANEANTAYRGENGVLVSKSNNAIVRCPGDMGSVDYVVGSTVQSIAGYAFHKSHLRSLTINENVKTISSLGLSRAWCETLKVTGSGTTFQQNALQYCDGNIVISGTNMQFQQDWIKMAYGRDHYMNVLNISGSGHNFAAGSFNSQVVYLRVNNCVFQGYACRAVQPIGIFDFVGDNNTFNDLALCVQDWSLHVTERSRVLEQTNCRVNGKLGRLSQFDRVYCSFIYMIGNGGVLNEVVDTRDLRVEFAEGLDRVPGGAFQGMTDLTGDIFFPSTMVNVWSNAFEGTRISRAVFKARSEASTGTISLKETAFANCIALSQVCFGDSENQVEIASNAFSGCPPGLEILYNWVEPSRTTAPPTPSPTPTPTPAPTPTSGPTPTTGPTPTSGPTPTTGPTPTSGPTPTTGPTPTSGPTTGPTTAIPTATESSDGSRKGAIIAVSVIIPLIVIVGAIVVIRFVLKSRQKREARSSLHKSLDTRLNESERLSEFLTD